MTTHEQDALVKRLIVALKTTPPQQIFCKEHEAMKRRTWWQSAKMLAAIAGVLTTCAASVWWISTKSSEAATVAAAAVSSMKGEFVDARTFQTGQEMQDSRIVELKESTGKQLTDVKQTVDHNTRLLERIAGKIGASTIP